MDLAVRLLERAHNQEPASGRITLSLGEMYARSGSPQKALDLDPNFPLAHLDYAMLLARQGKYDDAIWEQHERGTAVDLYDKRGPARAIPATWRSNTSSRWWASISRTCPTKVAGPRSPGFSGARST